MCWMFLVVSALCNAVTSLHDGWEEPILMLYALKQIDFVLFFGIYSSVDFAPGCLFSY